MFAAGRTLRTRLDQHGNGTKTAPERRQYLSELYCVVVYGLSAMTVAAARC